MSYKDEIVDEVRRVREDHAAKFNYDIAAICADIRSMQSKSGRKVVSRSKAGRTPSSAEDIEPDKKAA